MLDLEHWVMQAQGRLGAEIKMASLKAVRGNIEVVEVRRNPFALLSQCKHSIDVRIWIGSSVSARAR